MGIEANINQPGTGGSGISGLTTNTIPKANSSTTIANSLLTDDGTTLSYNGIPISPGAGGGVANTTNSSQNLTWFSATTLSAVGDGNPVASWMPTGNGGADAAVAAGMARPTYRATGGPGGGPCLDFNGTTNAMANTVGGLPYSANNFYMSTLFKVTNNAVFNSICSYGTRAGGVHGKERQILVRNSGLLDFIGNFVDFHTSQTILANTWYLTEFEYDSSTQLMSISVNGTNIGTAFSAGGPFVAYTQTPFYIGTDTAGISDGGMVGSIAEIRNQFTTVAGPAISAEQRARYYQFLNTNYGMSLTPASNSGQYAEYTGLNTLGEGKLADVGSITSAPSPLLVVTNVQYETAALSVYGAINAQLGSGEHLLQINQAPNNQATSSGNTVRIQNLNSLGYSSIRALDNTGVERSAWGWGNSGVTNTTFANVVCWESSNAGSFGGTPVEMRIVQTGLMNSVSGNHVRQQFKADGTINFYKVDTDWSITPQTVCLGISAAGNLSVYDGCTLAVGTSTGTKIGTATSQKLGFYNATPVIQQATTGTTTGYTGNSSANILYNESTFTGGTGSIAYRVSDIVLGLKNLGLLAA